MSTRGSAIATLRERIEGLAGHELELSARLVAWAILLHADSDGLAYPGTARLCWLTGLSRRTVAAARGRLAVAFKVERGSSSTDGRTPTRYRFEADRCSSRTGAGISPVHSTLTTGAGIAHRPVQELHPEEPIEEPVKVQPLRVPARVVRTTRPRGSDAPWVKLACNDWNARFGAGSAPGGRIADGLKLVVKANGWDVIGPAWHAYLQGTKHPSPSAQDFAAHWSDWRLAPAREQRPEPLAPVCIGERRFR